jgi:glycosyltransferase involved in cell wall biosynthesis
MDWPRVNVVIPARNEEGYIAAALASVAAQAYPMERLDCVVVDNGSTDQTAAAIQRFCEAGAGLSLTTVYEPVVGVAVAKNRGAELARGDILVFLDADSTMAPDLISTVARAYLAGARVGSIPVFADSDDWLDQAYFGLMEFGKRLFHLHAQMFFCERALFVRLGGFDPTLRLGEDLEFLQRARRALAGRDRRLVRLGQTAIRTSPRRLHRLPLRLGVAVTFARWGLARAGLARHLPY